MKPWTKRDLALIEDQVSSFRLINATFYASEAIEAFIQARREEVVVAGLEEAIEMYREREKRDLAYAVNQPPDLSLQWRTYAAKSAKEARRRERLLARIRREGMPPAP